MRRNTVTVYFCNNPVPMIFHADAESAKKFAAYYRRKIKTGKVLSVSIE
jgi:hypothetical protein